MDVDQWKLIAIFLGIFVVLETAGIAWIFMVGVEEYERERDCYDRPLVDASVYACLYSQGNCYCYDERGELVR